MFERGQKLLSVMMVIGLVAVMSLSAEAFLFFGDEEEELAPGVTEDKIKIGTFQALSGPAAPIGTPTYRGMQSYFNLINEQGGINGREVELIVHDDHFDPSSTVSGVTEMVERDGVFSIVGGLGTPTSMAVIPYLEDNDIPFVYPAGGANSFARPPKDNVFVVQPNYAIEGNIMGQLIIEDEEFTASSVGLIGDDSDIGEEGIEAVTKRLEQAGEEPVETMQFSEDTTDFSSHMLRMQDAGAEVVVIHATAEPAAAIVEAANDIGYNPEFIGTYSLADPVMFDLAGEAWNDVYTAAWLQPIDLENPEAGVATFLDTLDEYYPDEHSYSYAAAGWVAAETFTEAMERMGDDISREDLRNTLEGFDGWAGDLAYDVEFGPNRREGVRSMYFMQGVEGEYEVVTDWIDYDGE